METLTKKFYTTLLQKEQVAQKNLNGLLSSIVRNRLHIKPQDESAIIASVSKHYKSIDNLKLISSIGINFN